MSSDTYRLEFTHDDGARIGTTAWDVWLDEAHSRGR